jgi:branched-chain amino acid aminotransferase
MEAVVNGYAEGIALDATGYISEASGANLFVIRNGEIMTAPLGNSVLPGITRDSILTLAREAGIPVSEQPIPREMLYIADEVFFTGTAAEITPILSVDRIHVGNGKMGPISKTLQKAFLDIVHGRVQDRFGWLTPVPVGIDAKQPVGV